MKKMTKLCSLIIACCLVVMAIFAQQITFAKTQFGFCDPVGCAETLQVCNERGCYWIYRCNNEEMVGNATCSNIRNGCVFRFCNHVPIWADGPIYPTVLRGAAIAEASIDPFIAMTIIHFGENNFTDENSVTIAVPRYIFGAGDAAAYIASWVDNNDPSTKLQYVPQLGGGGQHVAKELVTVSLKITSPTQKKLVLQHNGNEATVNVSQNNGAWSATLQ